MLSPLPTYEGYLFSGFYSDEALTIEVNPETVLGETDLTYYVKWLEAFDLTFDFNGGEVSGWEGTSATFTVGDGALIGQTYNLDPPTREGYVWTTPYWVTTAEGSTDAASDTVTADTTVYAYWVLDE